VQLPLPRAKQVTSVAAGGRSSRRLQTRQAAAFLLSLEKMTLPHELARIVLLEQPGRSPVSHKGPASAGLVSGVNPIMKNPYEVLEMKEQEIKRVRREVEALRVIVPLLSEESGPPAEEKPFAFPARLSSD
jgi:hypothetical protein